MNAMLNLLVDVIMLAVLALHVVGFVCWVWTLKESDPSRR